MHAKIQWEKEQEERYQRELVEWEAANKRFDAIASLIADSDNGQTQAEKLAAKERREKAKAADSKSDASTSSSSSDVKDSKSTKAKASASKSSKAAASAPEMTPEQEQDAHPLLSPDRPTLTEKILGVLPESESKEQLPKQQQQKPREKGPVMLKKLARQSKREDAIDAIKINKAILAPVTPLPRPAKDEVDQLIERLERSGTKPRPVTLLSKYKVRGRSTFWPPEKSIRSKSNFCFDENGEKVLEMTPEVIMDMVRPKRADFVGFNDDEVLENAMERSRKCDEDIKVAILPRVDSWSYKELKLRAKKHAVLADAMAKKPAFM